MEYGSPAGSTNCSHCLKYYYMNADGDCPLCPLGTDCDNYGSTLEGLIITPGYFRYSEKSTHVYRCPYPTHCVGGNVTGDGLCSSSSTGSLCTACMPGFYLRDAMSECLPCGDVSDLWWLGPALLLLALAFMASLGYRQRQRITDWVTENAEFLQMSARDVSARITAFFVTMQTIVLIQSNHLDLGGAPTPEPYGSFLNHLSMFSLDLVQMLPADCLVENQWSHFDSLLLETLIPIIILASILVVESIEKYHFKLPGSNWKTRVGYFVVVLLLVLPAISRRIAQTFTCSFFDNKDLSFLVADYSIDCYSEKYQIFVVYAVLSLFVYPIGVPLVFYFWLRQFRLKLDNPAVDEKQWVEERKQFVDVHDHPIASYGLSFRPQYWYYDVVTLVRRLTLTSFALIFTSAADSLIFIFVVSILMLVIERESSPYLKPETSMSVYILHWQVVLFIQGLLLADAALTDDAGIVTIGISLLLLNLFMILVLVFGARETMRRAALAVEKASRRTSAVVRRASLLTHVTQKSSASGGLEVELGDLSQVFSTDASHTPSGEISASVENPILKKKEGTAEHPASLHCGPDDDTTAPLPSFSSRPPLPVPMPEGKPGDRGRRVTSIF